MSSLQAVLQQLSGQLGGVSSTQTQQLVNSLNSTDEGVQLAGLMELCDVLNMSTPLTLSSLRPSLLVPPLLKCLQKEHNPVLMLMAARALTYMTDPFPETLRILISPGNTLPLLHHLRSIEDLEVSEQCLTCLEKVCENSSGAQSVLRDGGVAAMLGFVDFFTISSQRKVWKNVAAMSKEVNGETYQYIQESLPAIRQAIISDDKRIQTYGLKTLKRVIYGVRDNEARVDETFGDLGDRLIPLLMQTDNKDSSFDAVLSLIYRGVSCSQKVTQRVVESGIVNTFLTLLQKQPTLAPRNPTPASTVAADAAVSGDSSPAAPSASAESTTKSHLSVEEVKTVCNTLARLLIPCRDGCLADIEKESPAVQQLQQQEQEISNELDLLRQLLGAGEDDDDDEEMEEEEAEGDVADVNEDDAYEDIGTEEEEEEEAEVEEPPVPLRERIAATPSIRIENSQKHSGCRSSHLCDGCGSSCRRENWYRCNICRDHDFCGDCLLKLHSAHFEGAHSFTDMSEIPNVLNAIAASRSAAVKKIEEEKVAMYKSNPALLVTVLKAVPCLAHLFVESEAPHTRLPAVNFLVSAAKMATPEQFLNSLEGNVHVLCEVIISALSDSSLALNAFGVHLTAVLMEKLSDRFAALLVREGVTHSLLLVQQRYKPADKAGKKQKASDSPKLDARKDSFAASAASATSVSLSREIEALLGKFPALHDEQRMQELRSACDDLHSGNLVGGVTKLKKCILNDVTTFELSSNNVFSALREAFAASRDIQKIIQAASVLCDTSDRETSHGEEPSALLHLIHHCHAFLSVLDNFEVRSFGSVQSVYALMEVRLIPHSQAAEDSGHGGMQQQQPTFRIEPLANVQAIVEFIASKIIRPSSSSSSRGNANRQQEEESDNDDDHVREVLPELANAQGGSPGSPGARKSRSARPSDAPPPPKVWVRYQKHVLPLSMTMLQIVQLLSNPSAADKDSLAQESQDQGRSRVPADNPALRKLLSRPRMKPVTLYYKEGPFPESEGYKMFSLMDTLAPLSPQDDIRLTLPSAMTNAVAVSAVLESLDPAFHCSSSLLSENQRDVLTLLGLFQQILLHWSELLDLVVCPASAKANESVFSPAIPLSEFQHTKLSNKAMRHCSNMLLAGQHTTTWAVKLAIDCPFLFTPATRKYLFEVGFCGTIRSLYRMQKSLGDYGLLDRTSVDHTRGSDNLRLKRTKMRVWRDKPLECAKAILGGSNRPPGATVWEFEFYGEEGSGTGPTREFYHLIADAIRERKENLWLSSGESDGEKYFMPVAGLMPRPVMPSNTAERSSLAEYFAIIGRFISRAIIDEHIPSLHLSASLLKLLRGDAVTVGDVANVSESIYNVLDAISTAAKAGRGTVQTASMKEPCSVEALDLVFTLPGDDSYDLLPPNGSSTGVAQSNMSDYCDRVTDALLNTGISDAVKAFRSGFNDYIPLVALQILTLDELHFVIRGSQEPIRLADLRENCLADHGFTMASKQIQWLFEILTSFTPEDQSAFFSFLTGSPFLPVGGLSGLRPKLTVVRKHSGDPKVNESDQLPSAMTCQNYLKLPAYETKEKMEAKLRQAMTEGKGAFHLT